MEDHKMYPLGMDMIWELLHLTLAAPSLTLQLPYDNLSSEDSRMGILGFRKKTEQQMSFVESTSYSSDNKEENLHKLVSDNPRLVVLEQEGGQRLPTATIGSHLRLPSGELDLLLMDIEGNLTIVELKRDKTPRDVIAQILEYASDVQQMTVDDLEEVVSKHTRHSGLADVVVCLQEENPEYEDTDLDKVKERVRECLQGKRLQLLVVSYDVDDRIRRVTDLLRETYGMRIYSVAFDYFVGDDYEYFIPETIGVEGVKRIVRKELGQTQREYQAFYAELLDRLREKKPGITQQQALPQNCLGLPIGHSGIHLEWAFHGKPRSWFEVGLHFEKPSAEENKKLFDHFLGIKDELEGQLGKLEFQFPWGSRWARIYCSKQEGEMTEDLKNWAVETALKFYRVFKPRLDELLKT